MATFGFTVVVSGLDVENFDQVDRLFTTRFDILPADMDGVTTLDVELRADSGEEAVRILREHIGELDDGIIIERIDEDLVNTSEIAARLGVSRETPRTWAATAGGADHPFPLHRTVLGAPGRPQRLWCWADVHAWATTSDRTAVSGLPVPLDTAVVTRANARLLQQAERVNSIAS